MKTSILKLFLLLTLFVVSGCQQNDEDQYDQITERGYIVVGLDDTFAPMGFRDEANNIVGFDVDLANAVFEEMGLEVQFQPIDWAMKETELQNGNIDLIWNGYTITEAREEKVTFSDPYLENRQVIVVTSSSTIQSKQDLVDKEVGVQTASSSYDAVSNDSIVTSLKNDEPTLFDTNELAFRDLENGRIDAIVVDEILARYYINKKGVENYNILDDSFGDEQYGVGFRKTDIKLIQSFNQTFNQLKEDGALESISNKWFGEYIIK